MRPKTQHSIYDKYLIPVECKFCKKTVLRNKSYIKDHPRTFCTEECKVYFNDPKQSKIMDYINDNDFYYLIGLISTDGYINYPGSNTKSKTYRCMIKLNTSDSQVLYDIQNKFGGSLTLENKGNTTSWYVSNRVFVTYLRDVVGLTNNKTYNLDVTTWYNSLCSAFRYSFLHGCYDGDGGIYFYSGNSIRYHASICSASKIFAEMIAKATDSKITVRGKKQNKKATCDLYYIYHNRNNILKLKEVFYNPILTIYLHRKKQNFDLVLCYISKRGLALQQLPIIDTK